jgi:nucleotide-binding universal stress UspA family protein
MSLAAIMVYVDFDEEAEDRIGVAAGLAARFNSLLIGVAGWPLRKYEAVKHAVELPPRREDQQKRFLEELERLGEKFRRIAGANPGGVEWRSSVGLPKEVVAAEARAADLVVIGRELSGDIYRTFDPGTIILGAGRPVLVVPPGTRTLRLSRALIAWKNTRESRRAVRDAVPLLKETQSVSIAAMSPRGMEEDAREQIADVARYLACHHASVDQQIATAATGAEGPLLLRLAKDYDADLIVAGAYGHSRLGEWVFGGVTRYLLMTSTMPCLFSN